MQDVSQPDGPRVSRADRVVAVHNEVLGILQHGSVKKEKAVLAEEVWTREEPILVGVIPSGAVLQAERGISRAFPPPHSHRYEENKLHR
jgi:hypothetical protein